MCNYCEKAYPLIERKEVIKRTIWNTTDYEIELRQIHIDSRGYLRYVDPDDCNCLDSGEKVKINFCPMCGSKLGGQHG